MSISRQNLSIVIVTIQSEKVIHKCIKSIQENIPIIVVENSNDHNFKKSLESDYKNVTCIVTGENMGMGAGNNIGIKSAKTDYVYIINPDVTFNENTLDELFIASERISEFSIMTPVCSDSSFPNYKHINDNNDLNIENNTFKVNSIDGYSMLLNKKKLSNEIYFDENFFLYLENDDLCHRVIKNGGLIYVVAKAKINHLGASAVNNKFLDEIEYSRNWHWIWSKFYFNKKHYGLIKAVTQGMIGFITSIFKYMFYLFFNNKKKKKIYFNRASGFYNALIGKTSWYRPDLKD